MTDHTLAHSPFAQAPCEDARAEERERRARRRKAPRRYEVATQRSIQSVTATKAAAFRRARKLARSAGAEVVLSDRLARRKSQCLWIFQADELIRQIVERGGDGWSSRRERWFRGQGKHRTLQ